jgi:hypothetical protein
VKPLVIDLFCGLGGWTKGFLVEGYDALGFDIKRHQYGDKRYPAQLILQDVLTLHGSQFRNAAAIVASPPCQAYSYRAMPWKRAKALPPPSNELFDACFRIQREASEAAGHQIPMVVENVKGAQRWVGRAAWHYGSYYLWGDVPALMPFAGAQRMKCKVDCGPLLFKDRIATTPEEAHAMHSRLPIKNEGGSWFNVAHNTESGVGHNPVNGRKGPGGDWFANGRQGQDACAEGIKQGGEWWHDPDSMTRRFSSRSSARKAASAQIAEIPFDLAQWIARCFRP